MDSSDTTSSTWKRGNILLDEYLIRRLLGAGGMGSVYLVERKSAKGIQFAVKTLLPGCLDNDDQNRKFLNELRTWIELPDHPNIVSCYFYRTIQDRIAIFSEYVPGKSLFQLLGQTLPSIELVLDFAIQAAWGLQAAHDDGVIHLDVKSANLLVTEDNTLKITDFGLAQAFFRKAGKVPDLSKLNEDTVTSQGMTLAYCSPEQASGERVGRKSDIWSWGVTVLEMLTGINPQRLGFMAAAILEESHRQSRQSERPKITDPILDVLWNCFREDPADRWKNIEDAAEELIAYYSRLTGKPYHRKAPEFSRDRVTGLSENDRMSKINVVWDDPIGWLEKVYLLREMANDSLDEYLDERPQSRRALAINDLIVFEDVKNKYRNLIDQGRTDLLPDLAMVLKNMAIARDFTGDLPGAILLFDESLASFRMFTELEKQTTLWDQITVLINKAAVLGSRERFKDAKDTYDQCLELVQAMEKSKSDHEFPLDEIAKIYRNKALTLSRLGKPDEGHILLDRAIEIREQLLSEDKTPVRISYLADSYDIKCNLFRQQLMIKKARKFAKKAFQLMDELVKQEPDFLWRKKYANYLNNYGTTLTKLDGSKEAITFYDRAIEEILKLIREDDWQVMRDTLGMIFMNKASALVDLGEPDEALKLFDQAIEELENVINFSGRLELTYQLSMILINKADLLTNSGQPEVAIEIVNRAILLREQLVFERGRLDMKGMIAMAKIYKAFAFQDMGKTEQAESIARAAYEELAAEFQHTRQKFYRYGMEELEKRFDLKK